MKHRPANNARLPTPGVGLVANRASLPRRGCVHRWAAERMKHIIVISMLFSCCGLLHGGEVTSPLQWWAGGFKGVSVSPTNHPPVALTAYLKRSSTNCLLAFRLTNLSGKAMILHHSDLPWGYPYAISLAAITTDGQQVPNLYPIADKMVEIEEITLKPGKSLEGGYDIENLVQLSKAPKGKDILVLWSYEVPGHFKRPKPVCTGVVIIPKE